MSLIQVRGLRPLEGELNIQGSKNAALPMMAAAVLYPGVTRLDNVPQIQDVSCMMDILTCLGCCCERQGTAVIIDASGVCRTEIPEYHMKRMRSSVIVMGALLGRMGAAHISMPGGCSIGARPIDLHLYALGCLGIETEEENGIIQARMENSHGGVIQFPFSSVGATQQALLAAALIPEDVWICQAAREPEVIALCSLLKKMGVKIEETGNCCFKVRGVSREQIGEMTEELSMEVPGDRIVAGTYLLAVMAAGGCATLTGIDPGHLAEALEQMERMGACLSADDGRITITMNGRPRCGQVMTAPYPGFPTDLQSPVMAVMAVAEGESCIRETVFEKRFDAAIQLQKMDARILMDGETAWIYGHYPLRGCTVKAPDLRGGAALVIGALAAEGTTTISRCEHICRGYEDICRDLTALGADIEFRRRD